MSDFVHKPGRGTIWREEADKPSEWSGTVTLPDGTQAWLNLYKATDRDSGELRRDKSGNPYYQVTIKEKPQQSAGGGGHVEPAAESFDMDDSIPFATCRGIW
jgi:hypothetical protein